MDGVGFIYDEAPQRPDTMRTRGTLAERIDRRIESCIGTSWSNCAGTALFIVFEQRRDYAVWPARAYDEWLKGLARLDGPARNCLIAWQEGRGERVYIHHLGVVTSVDPLLVTSRHGIDGRFFADMPFLEVNAKYGYEFTNVAYYLPRKLRQNARSPS